MPGSYHFFKKEYKEHMVSNFQTSIKILDVGPGYGTYSVLLSPEFKNIDAIEIWAPYIDQFNLHNLYNNIHLGSITHFDGMGEYEYIIMGDVLEHIAVPDAQALLKRIKDKGVKCMVAVPYTYAQGAHEGNIHETHLQPDLTHELFLERYENMHLLFNNEQYGYYINY